MWRLNCCKRGGISSDLRGEKPSHFDHFIFLSKGSLLLKYTFHCLCSLCSLFCTASWIIYCAKFVYKTWTIFSSAFCLCSRQKKKRCRKINIYFNSLHRKTFSSFSTMFYYRLFTRKKLKPRCTRTDTHMKFPFPFCRLHARLSAHTLRKCFAFSWIIFSCNSVIFA